MIEPAHRLSMETKNGISPGLISWAPKILPITKRSDKLLNRNEEFTILAG
jgi:hypothetical protein